MIPLKPETLRKYVQLTRPILIEVARGRRGDKFITFRELMDEMGGPGRGHIGEVLEGVSCSEYQEGRHLPTALVVHSVDKLPGHGFWLLKCLPASINNVSDYQEIKFWEEECRRVWQYWATHDS